MNSGTLPNLCFSNPFVPQLNAVTVILHSWAEFCCLEASPRFLPPHSLSKWLSSSILGFSDHAHFTRRLSASPCDAHFSQQVSHSRNLYSVYVKTSLWRMTGVTAVLQFEKFQPFCFLYVVFFFFMEDGSLDPMIWLD